MELLAKGYSPVILNIALLGIFLFVGIWIGETTGLNNPELIEQWAQSGTGLIWVILSVTLLMILCAMTPLPAEAITLANGMIFGPLMGTAITWVSAMIGAYITYIYSKRFKDRIELNRQNEKWQRINEWIERWGVLGFLVARLIPVVPFFALNMGAAFLPLSARSYLVITGIAILPHIVIICFFGGHLIH